MPGPASAEPHLLEARELLSAGRAVEAEAALERAIAAVPAQDRGALAQAAGLAAQRAGEASLAVRWYRRAGGLLPADPEPLHDQGVAHLEAGEVGLAAHAQGAALARDPEHLGARAQRAAALAALGDDAGAARELAALLGRLGPQPALRARLLGLERAAAEARARRFLGRAEADLLREPLLRPFIADRRPGPERMFRAPFGELRVTLTAGGDVRAAVLLFDSMDASLGRSDLAYGGATLEADGKQLPLDEFSAAAVLFLAAALGIDTLRARRLLDWLLAEECGVGPVEIAGALVGWEIDESSGARRYGLWARLGDGQPEISARPR